VSRFSVTAEARSSAPPAVVWPLLGEARRWSEWSTVGHADLEREGTPPPDGVGAVRRFRTGFVTSREEVVEFEPPRRLVYTMLSGLPIRGYLAVVELKPDGSGTRITWNSRFEGAPRGTAWFWRRFLRTTIRSFARRLARAGNRAGPA
jgi:uncharacterized protein YndB with AHSA1/START domain